MMNPLEQYPHLFANGRFDALAKPKGYSEEHIKIIGVRWLRDEPNCWNIRGYRYEYKTECLYSVRECTLIARPISDMTDEELYNTVSHRHHKIASIEQLKLDLKEGGQYTEEQYTEDTLYLLSIGVYPFDQSHFKDGTVIDIREI